MTMTYAPMPTEQLNLRLITVSGDAAIMVIPDRVTITLGVESWHKELLTAKKNNEAQLATIVAAVGKFGIGQNDVQTDFVSIAPENKDEWDAGGKHLLGKIANGAERRSRGGDGARHDQRHRECVGDLRAPAVVVLRTTKSAVFFADSGAISLSGSSRYI